MEKAFIVMVLIMFQLVVAIEVIKTSKVSEVIAGIIMIIMGCIAIYLV